MLFFMSLLCRKGLHRTIASKNEASIENLPTSSNNVFDLANLVLRLLRSNDGVVLRRLLMTAVSAVDPNQYHLCD